VFEQDERTIETHILTFLHYKQVWAWKVHRMGTYDAKKGTYRANKSRFQIKGLPDIQGMFHGRALFIEVKSKKGRLTPEQKDFGERAQKEGALWFVARSVEEVEQYLNKQESASNSGSYRPDWAEGE
jgi:hypothetical protein